MQIVGIVREIGERKYPRKDGSQGSEVVVTIECRQPIALLPVSIHRDHKTLAAELQKMVGRQVLLPVQVVSYDGRNGSFMKWSTAGDGSFQVFTEPKQAAA